MGGRKGLGLHALWGLEDDGVSYRGHHGARVVDGTGRGNDEEGRRQRRDRGGCYRGGEECGGMREGSAQLPPPSD